MKSRLLRFGIVLFWLAMMGMLVHKELLSQWSPVQVFNYARLIPRDVLLRDDWMGIYYHDTKIGYTHNMIRAEEKGGFEGYLIENTTFLVLPLLGKSQYINFKSSTMIDENYDMRSFDAVLVSGGYSYSIAARHTKGNTYDILLDTGEKTRLQRELPPNLVFANVLLPFNYIGHLYPSQQITFTIFNPLTLQSESLELNAIREEIITLNQGEVETMYVVITTKNQLPIGAWVDKDRHMVKVSLPFKLTMIQEPVLEATALDIESMNGIDFYGEVAVPANIKKESNEFISSLKVKIRGMNDAPKTFEGINPHITHTENAYIFEMHAQKINEKKIRSIAEIKEIYPQYLEANSFIQSAHKDIVKQAKQITKGKKDALRAVRALSDWVFLTIEQKPTVSVPSAVEVLRKKRGDCNELVILFVALARSLGIPAYPVIGLVHYNNAFFYHSWAHVYVGEWIAIDPTFNQLPADATHIPITTGAISQYVDLTSLIGKIDIDVLDYKTVTNSERKLDD